MVSIRRRRRVVVAAGRSIFVQASKLQKNKGKLECSDQEQEQDQEDSDVSYTETVVKKRKPRKRKLDNEETTLRGVYYKNMKWQAAIKVGKKQVHLGTVSCREDAARLYDRAAYMCGREPNFALSPEVKQELDALGWDEFLSLTRKEIADKRLQRKLENQNRKSAAAAAAAAAASAPPADCKLSSQDGSNHDETAATKADGGTNTNNSSSSE